MTGARFDDTQRARLARVADLLIPAADTMPAASTVGSGAAGWDEVLTIRPELVDPLLRALASIEPIDDLTAERVMDHLGEHDPAAREALALVVCGAYYLDDRVRELVGYPGQEARLVNVRVIPDYLAEDLLDPVLARGDRFRPA